MSNSGEFRRAASHAEMLRCASLGDESFQTGDHSVGAGGTVDVHGQRLSGVLVDNVQHFEPALVGGFVELKVERPDMVGMLGS